MSNLARFGVFLSALLLGACGEEPGAEESPTPAPEPPSVPAVIGAIGAGQLHIYDALGEGLDITLSGIGGAFWAPSEGEVPTTDGGGSLPPIPIPTDGISVDTCT